MIVVLSAIAVAGGLLVGRWVAVKHRSLPEPRESRLAEPAPTPEEIALDEELSGGQDRQSAEPIDWSAFPCALADVVMRHADHAEAWLAGAVVLSEDAPAAALFFAPDAEGDRVIYARTRPHVELLWLTPVAASALAVGAEPPSALEIDGVRFDRARRLPLRAQRVGRGTPDVGGTAIVGEYVTPSGDAAIVLAADGLARAWRGRRLAEGEYEVWHGRRDDEKRER